MSDEDKKLAEWFERLRMVARSSTATNIEPWDIGAFLVAVNAWAESKMGGRGVGRCRACGVVAGLADVLVHDDDCLLLFLRSASKIDTRNAVRP